MGEFVPGYDAAGWYGVGAPKSTPADIVDKFNREVNAGLADTKLKARLADVGVEPTPMTPAEFGKLIADDTEKWGKVIQAANIKAEYLRSPQTLEACAWLESAARWHLHFVPSIADTCSAARACAPYQPQNGRTAGTLRLEPCRDREGPRLSR